jgi:hypothetical protein
MDSPPARAGPDERPVDPDEVIDLPSTSLIRHAFSDYPDLILASERITHKEPYGYIFRYDIRTHHVYQRGVYTSEAVMVAWMPDDGSFYAAYYPLYELPEDFS